MKQININMKEYIPVGAKNIRIIWNGEHNCNGDLIRLDGITIWFDDEEEEEKLLELWGAEPIIHEVTHNATGIVLHYYAGWLDSSVGHLTMPYSGTRPEAVHKWNQFVMKITNT